MKSFAVEYTVARNTSSCFYHSNQQRKGRGGVVEKKARDASEHFDKETVKQTWAPGCAYILAVTRNPMQDEIPLVLKKGLLAFLQSLNKTPALLWTLRIPVSLDSSQRKNTITFFIRQCWNKGIIWVHHSFSQHVKVPLLIVNIADEPKYTIPHA